MALFKWTLIFDGRGYGWSETYFFEEATEDFPTAFTRVANIPGKRAKLLGAECSVKAQRLSLVRNNAGGTVSRRAKVKRNFIAGTLAHSSDQQNMSLLVRFTNGAGDRTKLLFLGGVWDEVLPAPNVFNPAVGSWMTFWNSWVAEMVAARVGWMSSQVTDEADIVGYVFSAVTGLTTYTLDDAGLAWPLGDLTVKVGVEFPLSRSPLDGIQIVVPDGPTVAVTAKPRPAKPFTNKGRMKLFQEVFVSVGSVPPANTAGTIEAQVGVSRKRGRPLLAPRGRSAVQPRW